MKYFVIWSHVDCEDNKEGYLTKMKERLYNVH